MQSALRDVPCRPDGIYEKTYDVIQRIFPLDHPDEAIMETNVESKLGYDPSLPL